ncbi:tetratricopeptide repeat protein [Opitutus sp. GAS368]|jgi:tetratricopeptide (TPR) repeat protein|uniref:tetratricopeptide repeat protein n=1 Tax=Opitutus sp. GAS368 TaxID=1882749 RepID=UPI00087CD66D|nr:tetratricopeptide repeat protein [Opitutus sp. GAS368]SDS66173.1 Tetratricopeptide repeat-containing protein [Opitutus sp. GAS368]
MQRFCAVLAGLSLTALGVAAVDPAAFKAAVELYQQHKPLEAQKAFETLAQADGKNADIQFYLGRLALQRDDHEQAVACFEKAVALVPDDARFHHRLGDAYGLAAQKAGLFSKISLAGKCQAEYEKAVELDGKSVDARQSLFNFYLQAPGFAGGSKEKALTQAEEIKRLDPPRGRQIFAAYYANEQKYALALAEFDEVLKDKPDDYTSLYQVGRLAANTGQFLDRGLAALRRCVELPAPAGEPGHAAAHWRIGNILEKQGDKPGARAAYEASLKADPKFPQAIEALKKL